MPTNDIAPSSRAATTVIAAPRRIVGPALDARRALERCRNARLPTHMQICQRNLAIARALRAAGVPSLCEMNTIIDRLDHAHQRAIDERSARLMVSAALDDFGRQPRGDQASLVVGLASIAIDSDVDDLIGLPTVRMSPLVFQLALTKLVRTLRFFPTPAELREACSDVSVRLNELRDWLTRARDTIEQIEEIIVEFGNPNEIPWFDRSGLSDEIEV